MSFERGHALLIGTGKNHYHPKLNTFFPAADLKTLTALLQNSDLCGYPSQQVKSIIDQQATAHNVSEALNQLASLPAEATVFLFFTGYSSWGTDGLYYLLTYDTQMQGNKVKSGLGISEETLLKKLQNIQAKRCVIFFNVFDASYLMSSVTKGEKIPSTSNPNIKLAHAILGTGQGRILISSSHQSPLKYSNPMKPSTVFTEKLIKGLAGEASGNHGYISAFALYEYLYQEIMEEVHQKPTLTALDNIETYPIAIYRGASIRGVLKDDSRLLTDTAADLIPPQKARKIMNRVIIEEGGTYVGGNVNLTGGSFIGRDQNNIKAQGVKGNLIAGSHNTVNNNRPSEKYPDLSIEEDPYHLRGKILEHLSLQEIKNMVFDLGLNYDRLDGQTVDGKVIALIKYCHQRGRTEKLLHACEHINSYVNWRS